MGDSAMVIMWPSHDADNGSYTSPVTLSQRKAPYETMPTPDPNPPFIAALDNSNTSVRSLPKRLTAFLSFWALNPLFWVGTTIGHRRVSSNGIHSTCESLRCRERAIFLTSHFLGGAFIGTPRWNAGYHLGVQPHAAGVGKCEHGHLCTSQARKSRAQLDA